MATASSFAMTADQLPQSLPIFPLSRGLLLPGGQLPLIFFEPRYLNMAQDALASRDRMIGFVMPRVSEAQSVSLSNQKQALYPVGCAGRITAFEETADEKLVVKLTGYSRFKIKSEIPTLRGYRRIEADWNQFEDDFEINPNPDINRDGLISAIKAYSNIASVEMDWQALEQAPNFTLITFFAMSLPFSNHERQKLLEADTVEDRAALLEEYLGHCIERHQHESR